MFAGRFSHCCGPKHVDQSPYVRVSFASATHAELREGMKRVGATLRAANSAAQSPLSGAAAALVNSHHANQALASANGCTGSAAGQKGQNGHADSAMQQPQGLLHQGLPQNGHAAGVLHSASTALTSSIQGQNSTTGAVKEDRDAAEGMQGLRVSEDAGRGAQKVDPMPDGAAKIKLASGSPEITANALASQPAKTLNPRDSAWKT